MKFLMETEYIYMQNSTFLFKIHNSSLINLANKKDKKNFQIFEHINGTFNFSLLNSKKKLGIFFNFC